MLSEWALEASESFLATLPPKLAQDNEEEVGGVYSLLGYTVLFCLVWTLVIVYLQNFSEFYFGGTYVYFYTDAEVHYPFIVTKQEEISYRDKINRGKQEMQSELC